MMLLSWLIVSEVIKNLAEATAIVFGGGWAFYKFILLREKHSKTELKLELEILGIQKDSIIVELVAICHNKGSVREYIDTFTFELLLLSKNDNISLGDKEILNQLVFKKHINEQRWVPKKWEYTFFDPGIELRYSHVTYLPLDTTYILLQTRFFVKEKKTHFNSAQKVFAIPKSI